MDKINFSDKEIEFARAASLVGFDVVEKYESKNSNNVKIRLSDSKESYNIKTGLFHQLKVGDRVSLDYIIHSREINSLV